MARIIKQDVGVRLLVRRSDSCNTCTDWIEQMDRWGAKGCRKYRHLIEEHLIDEAKKRLVVIGGLAGWAIKKHINGWIDRAIEETELAQGQARQ